MKQAMACAVVLLGLAGGARADMPRLDRPPPPRPDESTIVPMIVSVNPSAGHAHLAIPRRLMAAAPPTFAGNQPAMVIAGLGFSWSVIAGGLWLVQFRYRPIHRGKVALTVAGSLLLFGCGLWLFWPNQGATRPWTLGPDNVQIEVVEDGEAIRLTLPPGPAARASEIVNPK